MNEKMERAILECCKNHAGVLSQDVIDFIYDLANTVIKTTDNVIDDAFIGVINTTKPMLEKVVADLVDKIDEE